MSDFEAIQTALIKEKSSLEKKYHVKKIGIFGSFARNEQNEDSDLDILVELGKPLGFEFFDLQQELEKISGRKVDLVTEKALKPQLKKYIIKDIKYL